MSAHLLQMLLGYRPYAHRKCPTSFLSDSFILHTQTSVFEPTEPLFFFKRAPVVCIKRNVFAENLKKI